MALAPRTLQNMSDCLQRGLARFLLDSAERGGPRLGQRLRADRVGVASLGYGPIVHWPSHFELGGHSSSTVPAHAWP
jgi:hypothetical protein